MKVKVLLIAVILFLHLLFIMVTPVSAVPTYNWTHYDPQDDVMRVRTDGDVKFASLDNVEVTKITSTYVDGIFPQILLTMTVVGTIQNNDFYKYIFIVISDGDEYIFEAYTNGVPIGFKLGSDSPLLGVAASGEGTDTLTIGFSTDTIGPPTSIFKVSGAAIYSDGYHERYMDSVTPDKLILITEPSDGSTVNGTVIIRGVLRNGTDGHPNGTVKIAIDGGPLQSVNGTDPWSYNLDTTALSEGMHTIYVEVEGAGLDNAQDEITIYVNQNVGSYPSFNQKPEPHKGDWYQYESLGPGNISGLQMEIVTDLFVQVVDYENITVGGTDYEAYRIKSYTENEQNFGYIQYQFAMDKTSWKEGEHFGIVKENTITVMEMVFHPDAAVNKTNEFSPPLETYNDFSIITGFNNRWMFNTTADSASTTIVSGEGETENPPYTENLKITGECLYYKTSHQVFEGTFYDIFVLKTYYENPGMYIVEYYSPELGVPVQIDTFDPSRNLITSLGLRSWEKIDFFIEINNVTVNPSEPITDSINQISVDIKNFGEGDASNLTITITDNGNVISEQIITSILSNEAIDLTINWTPGSPGDHTIKIVASYIDINFAEETVSIEVSELIPTIQILDDVTINPDEPRTHDTVNISLSIKNVGEVDASNLLITITDNGNTIAKETIDLIFVNETTNLTVDWLPEIEGNHTIRIVASYNEKNLTEKTIYIEVLEQIPIIEISNNITFNPDEPRTYDTVNVTVYIKNIGEWDATNLTITVMDNESMIVVKDIALILPDQAENFTFQWIPDSQGNQAIKIIVSYSGSNLTEKTVYIKVLQPVPPNPDSDGDGLPDTWEEEWFDNLTQGPDDDYDGDGHVNLEEYNVSDPTDSEKTPLDIDGDSLPDSWELEHFDNLDNGPMGDWDNDTIVNIDEYERGTDPTISDFPSKEEEDESFLSQFWWIFILIAFVIVILIAFVLMRKKPPEITELDETEEPTQSSKDNGEIED